MSHGQTTQTTESRGWAPSVGAKRSTRKAAATHQFWDARPYQKKAVQHLLERGVGALFLDPGLGKTSVVLDAFSKLLQRGTAKKCLVVAPLRVCQLVWRQEGSEWTQFRHLRFSLIHGNAKKRTEALEADADIYLINPEGIAWLAEYYGGGMFGRNRRWPFDTVVIDELTKFKNAQAKRHKKFRPLISKARRRWGLTGTPIPNGYMDIFGQMLILDEGVALGRFITHFRDKYFTSDFTGFGYLLKNGADKKIEEAIRPYVLRMSAEDYLDLPPLIDDIIPLELTKKEMKHYRELKKEMLTQLDTGEVITSENAGGVYIKLKQLANGAVYIDDGKGGRKHIHLHDYKLDAMDDLLEELQGKQLLVAYEFRHDLQRLRERYPNTPYIGHGVNEKQVQEIERKWNAGELPMLFAHPASAGHGLNFQKSSASHILWFSTTIDLELYEQFIRRLQRSGNQAERIINHALVVKGTVDELSLDTIAGKAVNQSRLLAGLNADIVEPEEEGETDMAMRKSLSRKREVEDDESTKPKKKGWSGRASADDDEDEDEDEDEAPPPKRSKRTSLRDRAKAKREVDDEDEDLEDEEDDEDEAEDEKPRFSKKILEKLAGDEDDEDEDVDEDDSDEEAPFDDDKPKRSRSRPATRDDEDAPKPSRRAKAASPRKGSRSEADADEESTEDEAGASGSTPDNGGSGSDVESTVGDYYTSEQYFARAARERAVDALTQLSERFSIKTPAEFIKAADMIAGYILGE